MVSIIDRSFSDPHDYEETVRGSHVSNFAVSERGVFAARLTIIDLGPVWLQKGSDNLARTTHIGFEEARRSVVFLADRTVSSVIQSGNEFGVNDVVSFGQASSHFQRTFGPIRWAAMSLPADRLEEAARVITGKDMADLSITLWAKPSAQHLTRLRRLHHTVDQMARSGDTMLDHPETRRALERSLTTAIVACLAGRIQDGHGYGWHRHQQIMRLFKEWLDANIGRPVYLQDICTALDVSAPTLRRCCEEHLGMSPMQYLWLRRMNLVRQELQQNDSSTSVTGTAMNFGFWHLGRFAAEYRSLFGEAPRATLAKPPLSRDFGGTEQ